MPSTDVPLGVADLSLSAQIYETVRERIIEGILQAGTRIRERDLAEEFQVSRIPIREALPRLESEGFVKTIPRRGTVVTELTYRDVEELFAVRGSLEVLAAKLAAQASAAGASTDPLFEQLTTAEKALERGNDHDIAAANSTLHEEILALSGNRLLISLMGPVNGRVRRLFRLEAERDQQVLCTEHRGMCLAIAAGAVDLAGSLALAHVEHSRIESLKIMRERLADS